MKLLTTEVRQIAEVTVYEDEGDYSELISHLSTGWIILNTYKPSGAELGHVGDITFVLGHLRGIT